MPEGSSIIPGLLHLGLCPLPLAKDRGPAGESSSAAPGLLADSFGRVCTSRISILAVPLSINYGSTLTAIHMLKLFICSWLSSRQRQKSKRLPLAALRPPVPPWDVAPQAQEGMDPAAVSRHLHPGEDAQLPSPSDLFLPCFPGKRGAVCGSVVGRIQPISPSADFPP